MTDLRWTFRTIVGAFATGLVMGFAVACHAITPEQRCITVDQVGHSIKEYTENTAAPTDPPCPPRPAPPER